MPDNNHNNNQPITALKENPPASWLCCIEHSGRDKNIISFLEKLFNGIYSQQKHVIGNVIRTNISMKNSEIKYNIIFKYDETSTAITPLYLNPMPCRYETCKYNSIYTHGVGNSSHS